MKKLIAIVIVAASCTGCVWTRETSEVIVHKDANGKITGYDYSEKLKQHDVKPWSTHFGKYLYKQ